jgi:hypothetical protein
MNPPKDYTIQELTHDVRVLMDYLHERGILNRFYPGVDFNAMTILTKDGEIDVDVFDGVIEIPPEIVNKIRRFISLQGPTS